jgi:hypothetical protein
MTQSTLSGPFSLFALPEIATVLFRQWQALRRNEKYQRAAQECLRNLQALYDQWVMERQTLRARPALSPNASAVTTEIDGLARINRRWRHSTALQLSLEEKRWWLLELLRNESGGGRLPTLPAETQLAIIRELIEYWEWEKVDGRLTRAIAEYERVMDTLACATHFFNSWDPSLEILPGQPSTLSEPDQAALNKFTGLCADLHRHPAFSQPPAELLQQFPPLATLSQQHGILLPLDPRILQLPLRAALAVFPGILPSPARIFDKSHSRSTNVLAFNRTGPQTLVFKVVKRLLSAATSRLLSLDRYRKAFQVYDLRQGCDSTGKKLSWTDIGRQVLPEEFQKIKHPFVKKNRNYRKLESRIKALYADAKKLIDTT